MRFLGSSMDLSDASHCPEPTQGLRVGARGAEVTADVNSGVCHETELLLITLSGLSVGFLWLGLVGGCGFFWFFGVVFFVWLLLLL